MVSVILSLARYLSFAAIGAVLGSRPHIRSRPLPMAGRLQFLSLMVMIAALGVKLGADEQVFTSLGQLGLAAFALTLAVMAGSLLCVTLLRRFILKLDWRGCVPGEEGAESSPQGGKADNALTYWIVGMVAAGVLAGRFILPEEFSAFCGYAIDGGLYLLLFFVGLDMGRQGTALRDIQRIGWRGLAVPLAVGVGTLAGAALVSPLLSFAVKDCAAAAAGFGWYSLAPNLLASYSLPLSAVCFLSNVMREIFSILAIPLVARRVGFMECAALPGAAAMDTVLPVILRATNQRTGIYAFTSGVLLSFAVPMLVPALITLPY